MKGTNLDHLLKTIVTKFKNRASPYTSESNYPFERIDAKIGDKKKSESTSGNSKQHKGKKMSTEAVRAVKRDWFRNLEHAKGQLLIFSFLIMRIQDSLAE